MSRGDWIIRGGLAIVVLLLVMVAFQFLRNRGGNGGADFEGHDGAEF